MSDQSKSMQILDELMANLDKAAGEVTQDNSAIRTSPGDAIDQALNSPGRTTAVRSLRHSPEAEAFRTALQDGLILADTANRFLRLVNELIVHWLGS